MISIREISDNKSTISSTRWAFSTIITFDIIIISLTIIAGIISHFIGKPFDSSFFGSVALLLGIPTGLSTGAKAMQGWEPHKDKTTEE